MERLKADSWAETTINMFKKLLFLQIRISNQIYFWPLIAMAGKMVQRIVLNVWNVVEPGGAY